MVNESKDLQDAKSHIKFLEEHIKELEALVKEYKDLVENALDQMGAFNQVGPKVIQVSKTLRVSLNS